MVTLQITHPKPLKHIPPPIRIPGKPKSHSDNPTRVSSFGISTYSNRLNSNRLAPTPKNPFLHQNGGTSATIRANTSEASSSGSKNPFNEPLRTQGTFGDGSTKSSHQPATDSSDEDRESYLSYIHLVAPLFVKSPRPRSHGSSMEKLGEQNFPVSPSPSASSVSDSGNHPFESCTSVPDTSSLSVSEKGKENIKEREEENLRPVNPTPSDTVASHSKSNSSHELKLSQSSITRPAPTYYISSQSQHPVEFSNPPNPDGSVSISSVSIATVPWESRRGIEIYRECENNNERNEKTKTREKDITEKKDDHRHHASHTAVRIPSEHLNEKDTSQSHVATNSPSFFASLMNPHTRRMLTTTITILAFLIIASDLIFLNIKAFTS